MTGARGDTDEDERGGGTGTPPRSALDRVLDVLVGIERAGAALLLLTIIGLIFGQVVARYVFGAPFYWSDELARYTYVWFSFVSAVFVAAQRHHIRVDLLHRFLTPRAGRLLDALAEFIVIGTCAVLVWGSWSWLLSNATPRSSALRLPMIWLYGVVWACFAAMALHNLVNLVRAVIGTTPESQAETPGSETIP